MVKEHSLHLVGRAMTANGRTGIIMVKEHTHLEKGNGKETNMWGNSEEEKKMGKGYSHILMETNS